MPDLADRFINGEISVAESGNFSGFRRRTAADVRILNILNERLASRMRNPESRSFRRGPEYHEWAFIRDIQDVGAVS